jgi:hypothetical protein
MANFGKKKPASLAYQPRRPEGGTDCPQEDLKAISEKLPQRGSFKADLQVAQTIRLGSI